MSAFTFTELFNLCGGVKMNQYDGLPLGICSTCTFQLASSHNFRQQCIQSVEMLVAVKLSFADDKKAYDTEVRVAWSVGQTDV